MPCPYDACPHLQVIAEGIENQLQLEILREPGGNAVQGYLIGQPQTPRDIDRALEREIVRRDLHNSHP
jgi:EAL domain-containing protein (putative c-di-GMP-specific phosphodiesterase class I)